MSLWQNDADLQDIMRHIIRWVTIHDLFDTDLGIDENSNLLDHPCVFITVLPFFHYVESLLCKPKSSVNSYTNSIRIVTSVDSDRWKWSPAHDIASPTANFGVES